MKLQSTLLKRKNVSTHFLIINSESIRTFIHLLFFLLTLVIVYNDFCFPWCTFSLSYFITYSVNKENQALVLLFYNLQIQLLIRRFWCRHMHLSKIRRMMKEKQERKSRICLSVKFALDCKLMLCNEMITLTNFF